MKKLFQGETTIPHHTIAHYKKERIEKEFIIQFFESLPVESLKELIKFEEIDPNNKLLWSNFDDTPEFIRLLYRLEEKREVMYKCEVLLEV